MAERFREFFFLITTFLGLGGTFVAMAAPLPEALEQAAKAYRVPLESLSLSVRSVDRPSEEPLLDWNAMQSVAPASTAKLVTTYAALDILGPDYRWRSQFWADTPPNERGVISHLYLKGSGDPSWVVEGFQLALNRLRQLGVKTIQGDLIVDRHRFASMQGDPADFDGRGDRPYNQLPDAALVNYNSVSFEFVPDPKGQFARVVTVPALDGVEVPDRIALIGGGCGDWKASLGYRIEPIDNVKKRVVFAGGLPKSCGPKRFNVVSFSADEYLERLFRALWQQEEGQWLGHVRQGAVPEDAVLLAENISEPLREEITLANKWSNNQIARHLFLSTVLDEASCREDDCVSSPELARKKVLNWLSQKGVDTQGFVLDNGSGLSRIATVTASGMTQMLCSAWSSPMMPEFIASLPIAGVDGTMRKRVVATGSAHIKTGYLADVRAIGGYIQTSHGDRYAIFATVEGSRAVAQGIPFLNSVIQWVYEH